MDVRHAQTGSGVAGAKVQGIATYNNSVFRGKYCQLIEASNEVPTRGNVASDEDAEGHGREGDMPLAKEQRVDVICRLELKVGCRSDGRRCARHVGVGDWQE
ncbi:hypothetical protein CFAM422_008226 [Trichoderma lentiforme]|uniref:Uncharacterized protein n=1 Tax=Trichoderma lentiforme TaxID=1567552 RepID=A0A9P5CA50_9HYPO|nr:hypothetical protein CFAM422_008226 [Trichoderma lentiforme]